MAPADVLCEESERRKYGKKKRRREGKRRRRRRKVYLSERRKNDVRINSHKTSAPVDVDPATHKQQKKRKKQIDKSSLGMRIILTVHCHS